MLYSSAFSPFRGESGSPGSVYTVKKVRHAFVFLKIRGSGFPWGWIISEKLMGFTLMGGDGFL